MPSALIHKWLGPRRDENSWPVELHSRIKASVIIDDKMLGAWLADVSITSEAGTRQVAEAVVEAVLIGGCLVVAAAV